MHTYLSVGSILCGLLVFLWGTGCPEKDFHQLMRDFDSGYAALHIAFPSYDYREELRDIPDPATIVKRLRFFHEMEKRLAGTDRSGLELSDQVHFDHIAYEIQYNIRLAGLQEQWRSSDTAIPAGGLSSIGRGWYLYRIARFTSIDITPEELFAFGEDEVTRVQGEIRRTRAALGFANDSAGLYHYLASDTFYLTDKAEILARYQAIDARVRSALHRFVEDTGVSRIAFMEWPGADRYTPPGYYSPSYDNAYGVPVFHFNFHDQRHNIRSMEWLYLHEAIPGHHYQWWMRERQKSEPEFKRHFSYSGNFEGWAAYVEYSGRELGVYGNLYSELGKWEWDLVRSVRILIDVGIHYYGWTEEEALACWMRNVPGQDAIAEREVRRCTNWPGQALSYKAGAWRIGQMAEKLKTASGAGFSLPAFHRAYLEAGQTPLSVIEDNIEGLMQMQ